MTRKITEKAGFFVGFLARESVVPGNKSTAVSCLFRVIRVKRASSL
jgi:hypothetical protein